MRVLLDENLPRKLKHRLAPVHDAVTVRERGWAGVLNGELLAAAAVEFDAFVTMDRGIAYQHDVSGLPLRVVVVRSVSNAYPTLLPLVPSILAALEASEPGRMVTVAG